MVVIDTSLKVEDEAILYHINASDVYNLLQDISGAKLIVDLRSKEDYDRSHIRTSINLPPPPIPPPTQFISKPSTSTSTTTTTTITAINKTNEIKYDIKNFNINKYISSNATAKHWNLIFNRVVVYSDKPFLYNIDELESLNENNYTGIVDINIGDWDEIILKYFLSKRKKTKIIIYQNGFSQFQQSYPFMCNSSSVKINTPLYPSEVIVNFLYLGGAENASIKEQLVNLKITHIVNMASELDDVYPHDYKYYRADLDDRPHVDIKIHFQPIIDFINQARQQHGRVLVHCAMGISRSTAVVLAYLMKVDQMTFQEAFKFVRSKRSFVNPNHGFLTQLKQYDQSLQKERQQHKQEQEQQQHKQEHEGQQQSTNSIPQPMDHDMIDNFEKPSPSPLVSSTLPTINDYLSTDPIILKDVPAASAIAAPTNQLQKPKVQQVQSDQKDPQLQQHSIKSTIQSQLLKTPEIKTTTITTPSILTTSLTNNGNEDSIFKLAEEQLKLQQSESGCSPRLIPQSSL